MTNGDVDFERESDAHLSFCAPAHAAKTRPARADAWYVIGSKNVPAPGPVAFAISAAKAGSKPARGIAAARMGRATASDTTPAHPNAVFDHRPWIRRSARAAREELRDAGSRVKTNMSQAEVNSRDVAELAAEMCGSLFSEHGRARFRSTAATNVSLRFRRVERCAGMAAGWSGSTSGSSPPGRIRELYETLSKGPRPSAQWSCAACSGNRLSAAFGWRRSEATGELVHSANSTPRWIWTFKALVFFFTRAGRPGEHLMGASIACAPCSP